MQLSVTANDPAVRLIPTPSLGISMVMVSSAKPARLLPAAMKPCDAANFSAAGLDGPTAFAIALAPITMA